MAETIAKVFFTGCTDGCRACPLSWLSIFCIELTRSTTRSSWPLGNWRSTIPVRSRQWAPRKIGLKSSASDFIDFTPGPTGGGITDKRRSGAVEHSMEEGTSAVRHQTSERHCLESTWSSLLPCFLRLDECHRTLQREVWSQCRRLGCCRHVGRRAVCPIFCRKIRTKADRRHDARRNFSK